jgi:hypothetical protein
MAQYDHNLTRRSAFAGTCRQGPKEWSKKPLQQSNQISGIASWLTEKRTKKVILICRDLLFYSFSIAFL